ncbi:MAG: hypothetical protein QMD61_11470 [Methanobacterium sp.]|nr:hypothetical protein [Methanobacterium sp.]
MDISDYYSKSFDGFRENLIIMVPQLVGFVLFFLIGFIGALLFILGLGPSLFAGQADPNNLASIFTLTNIVIFGVIGLFLFILIGLISSFLGAATIGMAKKIIETGRSNLETAMEYGKKYFIRVFLVNIIIYILVILLAIPAIIGFVLLSLNSNMAFAVLIIGGLIFIVAGIFLALALAVVNQSIVVGSKSVIESIKDSFNVFWSNKLKVFVVSVINFVISFAIGMILGLIPYIGSFLTGIVNIALVPYFILVLTYLYMDLKDMIPEKAEYGY